MALNDLRLRYTVRTRERFTLLKYRNASLFCFSFVFEIHLLKECYIALVEEPALKSSTGE